MVPLGIDADFELFFLGGDLPRLSTITITITSKLSPTLYIYIYINFFKVLALKTQLKLGPERVMTFECFTWM